MTFSYDMPTSKVIEGVMVGDKGINVKEWLQDAVPDVLSSFPLFLASVEFVLLTNILGYNRVYLSCHG
jgi:hypothetical protein